MATNRDQSYLSHVIRRLCAVRTQSLLWFVILFLAAILSVLTALLVIVHGDNGQFSDNQFGGPDEPVADGLSGEFSDDQFGGAYAFGWRMDNGDRMDFGEKKKMDFECYKEFGLFESQPAKLTNELFKKWITQNSGSTSGSTSTAKPIHYGDKRQQYNYVILQDEIIVAKWKDDVNFKDVLGEVSATDNCEDRQCKEGIEGIGRRDFDLETDLETDLAGAMINWFPEDSKNGLSPCWLDSDMTKGLLDAISKHLMLAQGIDNGVIENFDWENWKQAEVAYAGELIVDLVSCTYSLNNNSGTYTPKGEKLAEVAKHFGEKIGVGPFSYVNLDYDEEGTLTLREIRSTDNLRTEISDAPPMCP